MGRPADLNRGVLYIYNQYTYIGLTLFHLVALFTLVEVLSTFEGILLIRLFAAAFSTCWRTGDIILGNSLIHLLCICEK